MENNQFRAHQSAANVAITAELESADRCLVKMFCGTGKSLVMRNCNVVKHKNLVVYVLPSLALISQFRRDYLVSVANSNKMFICSEDKESDINITTDPTLIQQFVQCSGEKVICVTYDSLGTLFANLSGVRINVIVYDEAHHTVEQDNYVRIYTESVMYCDKQVFFTATPNNNNGIVMFDRDSDEDKLADCGNCVFEYTYLDGVRDGIINPFEIRVDVSSRFRESEGNDVDRVYESIARTILTTGNSRVLTFHSGVNGEDDTSVKNFVNLDAFMVALNRVISEEFPEKEGHYRARDIHMFGLYAGLDKKRRESILKDGLDVSPDNEIYIVSSCMTIGEGVDTKNANMCVFVDPKKSHVNIIQNIGRVLRKQAGCSTVLIPCLVNKDDYADCGEDAEKRDEVIRNDMKTGGDFSSILNVMAALKQEDPELYDMCLNVGDDEDDDTYVACSDDDDEDDSDSDEDGDSEEEDDESYEYSVERACKLTVFMGSDLSILWNISYADFSKEVCSAVLECGLVYNWYDNFQNLKNFINYNKRIPSKCSTNNIEKYLGKWLSNQKVAYKNKAHSMKDETKYNLWTAFLEDYNEYFKSNDDIWYSKFNQSKLFIDEHKTQPRESSSNISEKKMGKWFNHQITNYKNRTHSMKDETKYNIWTEFLEEYNEYFISNDNIWYEKFEQVKIFISENNRKPVIRTTNNTERRLGSWISTQHQHFKQKLQSMKDEIKYNLWIAFLEEYNECLQLKIEYVKREKSDHERWYDNFNQLKKFINTNKKRPQEKVWVTIK